MRLLQIHQSPFGADHPLPFTYSTIYFLIISLVMHGSQLLL